ncbi:MAG: hypothetical protein AAF456_13900 [Planctomycetota bacterium]
MNEKRNRQRRFKFSLRAALLLTTLFAVMLGCVFGFWVPRSQRQQQAVKRLEELGYGYSYSPDPEDSRVPNWLMEKLGPDYFCEVTEIRAYVTEQHYGLEKISLELGFLEILDDVERFVGHFDIPGPASEGAYDLEPLADLPMLREVDIKFDSSAKTWSQFDLAPLSQCSSLESVRLTSDGYTEQMFLHLGQCDQIKEVKLRKANVPVDWLKHLLDSSSLERIVLENTEFGINFDAWDLDNDGKLIPGASDLPLFVLCRTNQSTRTADFPLDQFELWLDGEFSGIEFEEEFGPDPMIGGGFGGGAGRNAPVPVQKPPAAGGGDQGGGGFGGR